MISGEGSTNSMNESTVDLQVLCLTATHKKYLIVIEKELSSVKMLLSLLPNVSTTCKSVKLISDLLLLASLASINLKSAIE